ncbi:MAG: CDP-diacylglycerol--glycerol-3-phosphate 3-phosphatidyltransferase [Candidatus Shapirobacteria bacterium]
MNIPNKLTISRIGLVLFFLVLAVVAKKINCNFYWYGVIFIFSLAALTDWLDGYLARSRKETTVFGAIMDPIADKFTVVVALLVLNWIGELPLWVTGVIVCRDYIVDGIRLIVSNQKGKVVSASWLGKTKTFTQLIGLIVLFLVAGGFSELLYFGQLVMYLSTIISILGMFDYFFKNRNILQKSLKEK